MTSQGATFSRCRKYRYLLWRVWDARKDQVLFIMLNPSTADENRDDPTIRRCIAFANSWGFGSLEVVNLFAYRSTNPKQLARVDDPAGPRNRYHLRAAMRRADLIVCAWGNRQGAPKIHFRNTDQRLHYLEIAKDGTPKHPLYLPGTLRPKSFKN